MKLSLGCLSLCQLRTASKCSIRGLIALHACRLSRSFRQAYWRLGFQAAEKVSKQKSQWRAQGFFNTGRQMFARVSSPHCLLGRLTACRVPSARLRRICSNIPLQEASAQIAVGAEVHVQLYWPCIMKVARVRTSRSQREKPLSFSLVLHKAAWEFSGVISHAVFLKPLHIVLAVPIAF